MNRTSLLNAAEWATFFGVVEFGIVTIPAVLLLRVVGHSIERKSRS